MGTNFTPRRQVLFLRLAWRDRWCHRRPRGQKQAQCYPRVSRAARTLQAAALGNNVSAVGARRGRSQGPAKGGVAHRPGAGASRVYPTCALKEPISGKPEIGRAPSPRLEGRRNTGIQASGRPKTNNPGRRSVGCMQFRNTTRGAFSGKENVHQAPKTTGQGEGIMNRQKPEDVVGAARPFTGAGISRKPARRPRGLYLRRAGQGRHHASGVPQCRAHHRAALRRAARSQDQGRADLPDRHRFGRFTHKFFRVAHSREDLIGQRDAIAHWARHVLRLDGPHAGLQGVADERARRQLRVLREVRRQRQELVRARAEPRAVHEPRHRQSAGRPR